MKGPLRRKKKGQKGEKRKGEGVDNVGKEQGGTMTYGLQGNWRYGGPAIRP